MRARWKSSGIAVLGGLVLALIVAHFAAFGGDGSVQPARSTITPATPQNERATVRKGNARVPGSMKAGGAASDSGTGRPEADQNDPVAAPTRSAAVPTPSRSEGLDASSNTSPGTLTPRDSLDLSGFENEARQIEADLKGEESRPREDLLAMYGKSASGAGRFNVAAAAYLMFLTENGDTHPYSPAIAMKLGDCLAPLDHRYAGISFGLSGPTFKPQWRMRYTPDQRMIRGAVRAYEKAAELATDDRTSAEALFKLGWVHRALGDWVASTQAWERCSAMASVAQFADDARVLAAENLELTNHAADAAEVLRGFGSGSTDPRRIELVAAKARDLDFAAAREAQQDVDPVEALANEIAARPETAPHSVYRSFARWFERRGDIDALLAVHRWACAQTDWSVPQRMLCRLEFVDDLLAAYGDSDAGKVEAAAALGDVVELASSPEWAVPAAIRRAALLRELGDFAAADEALASLDREALTSATWEPRLLAERIRVKQDAGDVAEAGRILADLTKRYPDYWELTQLTRNSSANGAKQEGNQ